MQKTALIVDDDRLIREALGELLAGAGFAVRAARDGLEACRLATELNPDVILLDLVMPVMDGLEVCQKLRDLPQFKYTPIIMLTARRDMEGRVNPFQVGADDYISKPFVGTELVARVQGNLLKKRTLEAVERKARDTEVLLQISDSINSSLQTGDILRKIVNRIAQHVHDVWRCSIAVVQEDERFGFVLASSDDPQLDGLKIDLEKYPEIREVIRTNRPLVINDVSRDPLLEAVRTALPEQKFNAILVLPVPYQQRVIGAMVVRVARSSAGIDRDEVEFCQLVASVSANALKNARQFRVTCEQSELIEIAKGRLEEELRAKAVYEQLFENASEGLAAFTRRGRALYINRRALEISGYHKNEIVDLNLADLLDKDSHKRLLRWLRRAGQGRALPERFDLKLMTRDDQVRLISLSLNELPDYPDLLVVAFRDVTDARQMASELSATRQILEQANLRLRELDRLRAEFLNTATHELRIPATIVHGYCSLLRESGTDNLTPQQLEFLDEALISSERLVDLINNILDLSRLEAGKMDVDLAEHDLCLTVAEALKEVQPLADKKELQLVERIPATQVARFDDELILRVLVNLLGNAIKYTPERGTINIGVEQQPGAVQVYVQDTGKGIPPERIAELFEEFSQLKKDDSRKGSGLGLSICKRIIDAHQGRIWAESFPGQGSRFSFTIPHPA